MNHDTEERVAVIAIHGVGQQHPGETAQIISGMLGRIEQQTENAYCFDAFAVNKLTIPVSLKWHHTDSGNSLSQDVKFSVDAINKLSSSDELLKYETTTCDSRASCNGDTAKVSVFELYWNDLSHAPSSFAKFLAELYQIFFHLASLGHKAVRFAANSHGNHKPLKLIQSCHNLMQLLLPTSIPMLNLFLIASILPVAILALPEAIEKYHWHAVAALSFSATVIILGKTLARTRLGKAGIFLTLIVGGIIGWLAYICRDQATSLLMLFMLIFGLLFAVLGSRALLNRYQPKLAKWAPIIALLFTALFLCFGMLQESSSLKDALLISIAFSVFGNFGILQIVWAITFILSLPIIFSPWLSKWPANKLTDADIRALQTGRIGILLSASLFFLTTVILWAALLKLANPIFCGLYCIRFDLPFGLMYPHLANIAQVHTLIDLSTSLFNLTVGNSANAYLALLLAALLIAIVGILPSAITEGKLPANSTPNSIKGFAIWLNAAFAFFKLSEWLLIIAWLTLAAGYTDTIPEPLKGNDWVTSLGVALAGSIPLLILGRKLLPSGLGQVLDITLDISNWMKERPFSINPRGRILVRYLSLLKHIASAGYDRIIIVAHSQGTVVTTDCLRLLEQSPSIRHSVFGESMPPIELVTAGSPLRQLYCERFPHQYGWVISNNNGPDIEQFPNVKHWINCYRSGDYVGRTIWNEPTPDMMIVNQETEIAPIPKTLDLCAGEGAHLHYFDGASRIVGVMVSRLILRKI